MVMVAVAVPVPENAQLNKRLIDIEYLLVCRLARIMPESWQVVNLEPIRKP
jgi:hypothetical protein